MGMLWVNVLALIVVGWIGCALSYVSTFLGVCATSGLVSAFSGPIDMDITYPDAEAYVEAQKASAGKPEE